MRVAGSRRRGYKDPATEPSSRPLVSESATPPVCAPVTPAVTDELLIEEISIDGMCGVY